MYNVIIALGSNHNQQENMAKAKSLLTEVFGSTLRFSLDQWTQPIDITSDKFLNCVGVAKTACSEAEMVSKLKQIESLCGNTKQLRMSNIIEMDIDLLQLGNTKYHPQDWQREYIKDLLSDLNWKLGSERR